ncbi:Laminin subunit gamma-1 [Lucilia cuprina]|nr:Laminin subunit gamma-1 [Lucilia cuprina]
MKRSKWSLSSTQHSILSWSLMTILLLNNGPQLSYGHGPTTFMPALECYDKYNKPQKCMPEFIKCAYTICPNTKQQILAATGIWEITIPSDLTDVHDHKIHHVQSRNHSHTKGEGEAHACCTSEYNGEIAFSTLEVVPVVLILNAALNYKWVTATDIRITLDRLNTFGDELFGDAQVLRSYFYAISDIAVGHVASVMVTLVNVCQHRHEW